MEHLRLMGSIGAAMLAAAIAFTIWRARRPAGNPVPNAADIHVPPAPFARYGH
jgi:hypothetical protein